MITIVLVILLLVFAGFSFTRKLATMAVVALVVLGRFVILSGRDGGLLDFSGQITSAQLFTLVTYLDLMTALVLAFHIGFLFQGALHWSSYFSAGYRWHFILDKQPWMRKATFFGLICFVGFPLAATGSIGGSIFGRLLGMSRIATFNGIMIGTLLGNGAMFFFSDLASEYLDKDNPYLKYGGFAVILTLVIILERRYRKLRDNYAAMHGATATGGVAATDPYAHDSDTNDKS